jgi:hypothetical protein
MKKVYKIFFLLLIVVVFSGCKNIEGIYDNSYKERDGNLEIKLNPDKTMERKMTFGPAYDVGYWEIKNTKVIMYLDSAFGFSPDTLVAKIKGNKCFFYFKNGYLNKKLYLKKRKGLASCTHKLQVQATHSSSVIELFNKTPKRINKSRSKGRIFKTYTYERRIKVVKLFNIETDTSKLNSFIVIDEGNFDGADYYGEIIVNDSLKYYYSSPYLLSDTGVVVKKEQSSLFATKKTEDIVFSYLKSHRFVELEALANEKGKTLSGSGFYSIGMYEKGMDSVYVKLIPAFIIK